MSSIRSIWTNKRPLISVNTDQTVCDAVEKMATNDIGAVLVLDAAGQIVGIFTERDCLQKVTRCCLDPVTTRVTQVMTSQVRYAKPDQSIEDCLRLMTERYFRHLPVLGDDQVLLGMVSIGDLVKARLVEQEFIIEQMEHYIADSPPLARQLK